MDAAARSTYLELNLKASVASIKVCIAGFRRGRWLVGGHGGHGVCRDVARGCGGGVMWPGRAAAADLGV